jgi:hypothetical protein
MTSLPLAPYTVSLPPKPQITSGPEVPLRVFARAVPLVVQTSPERAVPNPRASLLMNKLSCRLLLKCYKTLAQTLPDFRRPVTQSY